MVSASLTTLVCIWSFILQPITWCRRRSNIDQPGQFSVGGNKHWFNLADMACEEALYNSLSLRGFVGIDLGCGPVPDSTTITKFRKLINDNKLGEALFPKVGKELQERGFKLNTGIIIAAASSTENVNKARDPEVHQTKAEGQRLSAGAPGRTPLAGPRQGRQVALPAAAPGFTALGATYLTAAGHGSDTCGPLFRPVSHHARAEPGRPLTPGAIYSEVVKKYLGRMPCVRRRLPVRWITKPILRRCRNGWGMPILLQRGSMTGGRPGLQIRQLLVSSTEPAPIAGQPATQLRKIRFQGQPTRAAQLYAVGI